MQTMMVGRLKSYTLKASVPKQGHILHLGLDMAYGPVSREKLCFYFARLNKGVRFVIDMKTASQNVYFSHFVGILTR